MKINHFRPSKRVATLITISILAICLFFILKGNRKETAVSRDYPEIEKSGQLNATAEYNNTDFFVDGDSIAGFHYELLKAFADEHKLKLNVKPEMSFEKRIEGLNEGVYDIIAFGVITNFRTKDSLLLTQPILLNRQVLVQRKPLSDNDTTYIDSQLKLAKKKLYIVKGSPAIERIRNLSDEIADTIYTEEVKDYGNEQLIAMVASGDIDYAVCDETAARKFIRDNDNIDIRTAIGFTQFCGWAVSKQSPVLLDSLNCWLKRYTKTSAFSRLEEKYLSISQK